MQRFTSTFVPHLLFLVIATFSSATHAQDTVVPSRPVLRVLTYNIHHGRGGDDQVDLERIAAVIRAAQPDLVALQEVDKGVPRSGNVDQTAKLAKLTGMQGHFFKQIDFEGGEYGQAILSKTPLQSPEIHWLPGDPPRERRIVGRALVEIKGVTLWFATTHLHHADNTIRKNQVGALNRLAAASKTPLLLAGDFNATPASAAIRLLKQKWSLPTTAQPLLTFPADHPQKQIDYIVFCPQAAFRCSTAFVVVETVASDHAPLIATFNIDPITSKK